MATEIIMPKAGMTMEEGLLIKWLKEVGDTVESGEPLMRIETDKIVMEVEAYADGVLLAKFFDAGDVVPVTTVVGYIGNAGETVPDAPTVISPITTASPIAEGSVKATPYAKSLALEADIDLATISASGADGVIKSRDVQAAKTKPFASNTAGELTYLSAMRKTIAKRMQQAHNEIPMVTQNMKVCVDVLLKIRADINKDNEQKITINDIIIKACAEAVAEFSQIRSEIDMPSRQLLIRNEVNIGVAVALGGGLIVPVLFDADKMTLSEISFAMKDLIVRAKEGTLKPHECTGNTFTISNLGALGVHDFTPIINQPNAATLGVGCINDELALNGDKVISRKYLMLSLSFDHRIIDGADAAAFQSRIKLLLENPTDMTM